MGTELSREDVLFGRALLAFKLATRETLDACVAEKKSAPEPKTLARVAIERGVLTADQYRSLVEEVRKRGGSGNAATALPEVSDGGGYAKPPEAPPAKTQTAADSGVQKAAARFERHAEEVVADGSSFTIVTSSAAELPAPAKAPAPAPAPAKGKAPAKHPTDAAIRKKLKAKEVTFDFADCSGLSFLGGGTTGAVYKARDKTGNTIALKACADVDSGDKSFRRFLQERRVVKELQHPGIVRVHDIAIFEEIPYFTMDFVDGRKLEDALAKERPERDALVTVVAKLAETVAFAHDRGIVLRDVRPGNVIVRANDGAPILMDLGFAKDQKADLMLTAADVKIGTPLYTAPEVQLNPKKASQQSDVYSLGVILYEALCAKPPYAAKSTAALIELMVGSDPPVPSTVDAGSPKQLDAVCMKALARDPLQRHANAKAFIEDLERARRAPPPKPPGFFARLLAKLGIGKK